MTEFSTIPPKWDRDDTNALLDHGLEKVVSYIIRKNGSYYEAIKGGTPTDAGKIVYGGSGDVGGADGTDVSAVAQAVIDVAQGGKIFFKGDLGTFSTTLTLTKQMVLEGEGRAGWKADKNITRLKFASAVNGITVDPSIEDDLIVTLKNLEIAGTGDNAIGIYAVGDATHHIKLDLDNVSLFGWETSINFQRGYSNSFWSRLRIGSEHHGIYLKNTSGLFISDSEIKGTPALASKGINADGALASDDATLHLVNCGIHGFQMGLYIKGWSDFKLLSSLVDGILTGVGTSYGLWILDSVNPIIIGNFISTEDASGTNGVKIDNTDHAILSLNHIYLNQYGLVLDNSPVDIIVSDNVMRGNGVADIHIPSGSTLTDSLIHGNNLESAIGISIVGGTSGCKIRDNSGYITENGGTATLLNTTTSIAVTHGCGYTPSAEDIDVHPIETLGSASFWYVDTITSTQFTIHVNADPGADVDFKWSIRRI